jgi:hypothetical protein
MRFSGRAPTNQALKLTNERRAQNLRTPASTNPTREAAWKRKVSDALRDQRNSRSRDLFDV